MEKIMKQISDAVSEGFASCGYEAGLGRVTLSNRPDLCEFQCNGAMAGAKLYRTSPIMIAKNVVEKLSENPMFESVEAVLPGFINIRVSGAFLAQYLTAMESSENFECEKEAHPRTVVIDYGGPNVAKPLHVGHLRSAIIGECIKRLNRFFGNTVIGDVHLGDWGLQMGLIIEELRVRQPQLPYFDDSYEGAYPEEPPFTIGELEEIYPAASAKSKVDEEFAKKAHNATVLLQQGARGYYALGQHILRVSLPDLKRNYDNLQVSFDVWKKESDAQPYIADMVQRMKDMGIAYESQGALVVDVKEESDTKEVPPCILMKSDGASLYATTDLATLVEREKLFHPDRVLYIVDKRQEMHFTQVFRVARKSGIVRPETELSFLGFGTMNGKDGKPFKTREGGVMRLERLIEDIYTEVYKKILESRHLGEEDDREGASRIISLAALKYGDLSNQASKDYIFDMDRFTSFDGNTGPYILYNIVRIRNILAKYQEAGNTLPCPGKMSAPENASEKAVMLTLTQFSEVMEQSYQEDAPHRICGYVYDLANAFNRFYNETKILSEPDGEKREGYICLITLVRDVLLTAIQILGFDAPERM